MAATAHNGIAPSTETSLPRTGRSRRMSLGSLQFAEAAYPPSMPHPVSFLLFWFDGPPPKKIEVAATMRKITESQFRPRSVLRGDARGRLEWDEVVVDPSMHIHETTVDSEAALWTHLHSILFRPFPSDRPLWAADVICNTGPGRSVVATSAHHGMADGPSTVLMMLDILKGTDGLRPEIPGMSRKFERKAGGSMLSYVGLAVWMAWNSARGVLASSAPLFLQDSKTALKTATWPYATYSPDFHITEVPHIPVDFLKAVRLAASSKLDLTPTLHDVVYSVLSGALTQYVAAHPVPNQASHPTMRLINLAALPKTGRAPDDLVGNSWGVVSLNAAEGKSPLARLRHAAMMNADAKLRLDAFHSRNSILTILRFLGSKAAAAISARSVTGHTCLFTNVPLFAGPVEFGGAAVADMGAIITPVMTSAVVTSYNGRLRMNLHLPTSVEGKELADLVVEGFRALSEELGIDANIQ